ncbi:hypothetical protein Cgig2_017964 [Carnegiea gigantea]|uniref:Uncharacterized protein n=1 Tax=Carnegiea gigantea TaxID=171969 RepID=A0A9Q1K785_9CARY|nr:hypothetical protein Cgig2_017964 [Carnegiea gigantea]
METSAPLEVEDTSESSWAGGLRHGWRTQELHVHHDQHHYATSLRTSKEGRGGRELREASSSFRVRAYHSYRSEGMREALHANTNGRSREENRDHSIGVDALYNHRPSHGRPEKSTTASTLYELENLEEKPPNGNGPQSVAPTANILEVPSGKERPVEGYTTIECRKLRKANDRFLKRGPHFLREERQPARPKLQDDEYSMKIVAPIVGGYTEGITRSAWKAQLRGAQRIIVPTMVFGGGEDLRFTSPYNDPLVIEMKVASAIVWRILVDMESSMDIITWDSLKKLRGYKHQYWCFKSLLSASRASFSFFSFFKQCLYLAAASFDFLRSA